MKVTGAFYKLTRGETSLRIDENMKRALGVEERSVLHVVGMGSADQSTVFIASPYPTASWGSLFRASFQLRRTAGQLHQLLKRLNDELICCRNMELTDSLPLSQFGLLPAREPHPTGEGLVVPDTVTMVFEVPSKTEKSKARSKLHVAIRAMLEDGKTQEAKAQIQGLLKGYATVEWVSPMRTTGAIAKRWAGTEVNGIAIVRELGKERAIVRSGDHGLYLDVQRWRPEIWAANRTFADDGNTARIQTEDRVVIAHVDSDEKIAYWTVHSLKEKCIASFSVLFPAGGLENVWCEWIADTIRGGPGLVKGTENAIKPGIGVILSAQMSPRAEPLSDRLQIRGGRWASLRLIVEFAGIKGKEDAKRILDCFRELQGKTAGWSTAMERRLNERQYIVDALRPKKSSANKQHRLGTIVSDVVLLHESRADILHGIEYWNWANPFNFTKAHSTQLSTILTSPPTPPPSTTTYLEADSWAGKSIKDSKTGGLSRNTLVHTIVAGLGGPSGNLRHVAIVGAHRSGKTSILKSVQDSLMRERARGPVGGGKPLADCLLPIWINAAVCHPAQLLSTILRRLCEYDDGAKVPDDLKIAKNVEIPQVIVDLEERYRELLRLEARVALHGKAKDDWVSSLGEREAFLVDSRRALRETLDLFKNAEALHGCVVLVDEVPARGPWSEEWAQAFWRDVIESESFSDISWVISTSLPMRDSTSYSPLSNIFFEYNLSPLDEHEADLLISQICVGDAKKDSETGRPVLTLSARRFLAWVSARMPYFLQVCCYCMFERAKKMRVPVLTSRVFTDVLECDILPQLTDYLEGEWSRLPEETKQHIRTVLGPWPKDPREILFLEGSFDTGNFAEAPPAVQKALLRAGLTGAREFGLVAPLVAFWLSRSGRYLPEVGAS